MGNDRSLQADVVVVGGGIAGMAAAIELLDADRSVVLLDCNDQKVFGGLARESFGGVFAVGTAEQRKSGAKDSVDLAMQDWLAFGEFSEEDSWPRRWAEAYVSRCTEEVYRWLKGLGVKFLPVVNWSERGLFVPGNSVPRFHVTWGTGLGLVVALERRLYNHPRRDKLRLCFRHRVDELIQTAGKFTGCAGVQLESGQDFQAQGQAVIVAAGGIAGNLDMIRKHWYPDWGEPPEYILNGSHPTADGRMHELIEKHGGQLTHLEKMWNYAAGVHPWKPHFEGHGLSLVPCKSTLWVNYRGKRLGPPPLVGNFDTRYLVEQVCRQDKKYSWQVLNQRIANRELAISGAEHNVAIRDKKKLKFYRTILRGNRELARELIENCKDVVVAQSVGELSEKMNALMANQDLDGDLLAEEIRSYDGRIARGPRMFNDDQLRRIAHVRRYIGDRFRTCKFARIDDPKSRPLIAIRLWIVTRKSLGGVATDLASRVLDAGEKPLPGLYAIGETAGFGGGGIHGLRALEGTFLGACIFSGRKAGRAISKGS
jgi:predicted oxidoreductase